MTIRKITISINDALLKEIEQLASDANLSRSEWLAVAAKRAADRQITLPAMNAVLAQISEQNPAREARVMTASKKRASARKKRTSRRAAR